MKRFSTTLSACLLILGILLLSCLTATAKPTITKVTVNTKNDLVTLDAELIEAFNEKIKEAIEGGVPMTFTYEIELRKTPSVFGEEVISKNVVTQTVQFDTLKKIYQFSSQGKNVNRKVTTKSIDRYQELMLTLKDIPIAHTFKLDPDEKYFVQVKAEMEAEGLWFPFNYLLFFVPFNEFETPWTQSTPITLKMDPAFGVEASQQKSKPGIPAKGAADGIRSFNQ